MINIGGYNMGFKIGDRVEVNYPVDDFQGHVGIVKKIITDTELIPGKTVVMCYWAFLDKEIAFYESSLDLI